MSRESLNHACSGGHLGGNPPRVSHAGRAAVAVLLLALGTTAAPTGASAETIALGPSKIRVEHAMKAHPSPGIACGLDTLGLASSYWNEGVSDHVFKHPVGFHNWRTGGRRRCREGVSHTFLTRVQFPVHLVPDAWKVVSAKLTFTEIDENLHEEDRFTEDCRTVTGVVGVNLKSFREGRVDVDDHRLYIPYPPYIQRVPNGPGADVEVDATFWAQMWHRGAFDNHGISIFGRDYRQKKNRKACIANIGNIRLVIEAE